MTEKTHFFYFMLFSFTFIFNFPPFMRWLLVGRLCFRFLSFFWWFAVAHCPRCVYGRNFLFTTWWMDSQSKKWSNALKIIFIIGAALILFVHFALKLSFLLCWKTFFLLLFLTLFFDNNNVQICFSLSLVLFRFGLLTFLSTWRPNTHGLCIFWNTCSRAWVPYRSIFIPFMALAISRCTS